MSWKLRVDRQITRRLRIHQVFDENDRHKGDFQKVEDAMTFLIEHDIRRVQVIGFENAWLVDFEPIPWIE